MQSWTVIRTSLCSALQCRAVLYRGRGGQCCVVGLHGCREYAAGKGVQPTRFPERTGGQRQQQASLPPTHLTPCVRSSRTDYALGHLMHGALCCLWRRRVRGGRRGRRGRGSDRGRSAVCRASLSVPAHSPPRRARCLTTPSFFLLSSLALCVALSSCAEIIDRE